MNLLFNDRLAPMTSTIGFLQTPANVAANAYVQWQKKLQEIRGVSVTSKQVTGTFEEVLTYLLPLMGGEITRSLFVPTQGSWTAYFDNGWRGTDTNAVAYIARELNCMALRVTTKPNTTRSEGGVKKGRFGSTALSVFSSEAQDPINLLRSVAATNDGGRWVFHIFGEPLWFEDTEQYQARRVKDRFTFEMLQKYLINFEVDAFNEEFYMPPDHTAILVEKQGNLHPQRREFSLAEARQHY